MPVSRLSTELCVLSVPSCGHFFWALILPWCLYCRFVLFCLQASNGLRICLVSQSHKCPTGQHVSIMPSQWGSPSTLRLGTWGEQSLRRHCPSVQHSPGERAPLYLCRSLGTCLAFVLGLRLPHAGQAQGQSCSSGTSARTTSPLSPGQLPLTASLSIWPKWRCQPENWMCF